MRASGQKGSYVCLGTWRLQNGKTFCYRSGRSVELPPSTELGSRCIAAGF